MATATWLPDTYMGNWSPGTRHYAISDGTYVAVEVDSGITPEMAAAVQQVAGAALLNYAPRPTVIISVNSEGNATSLERLHTFPPGTTHEDALIQAGYEIGDQ